MTPFNMRSSRRFRPLVALGLVLAQVPWVMPTRGQELLRTENLASVLDIDRQAAEGWQRPRPLDSDARVGAVGGAQLAAAVPPISVQKPSGADALRQRPRRKPNRTLPKVAPPSLATALVEQPTDAELFRVRAFEEPLVPVGRATTPAENRALARALRAYMRGKNPEHVAPLLEFLLAVPDTPWRASLLANVGTVYSRTGYFSRALQSWTDAWRLAKGATDPRQLAVAQYAVGEWLELMMNLGQVEPLRARLDEVKDVPMRGRAAAKATAAHEALGFLTRHHHEATASSAVALGAWLRARRGDAYVIPAEVLKFHPSGEGTSLLELRDFARQYAPELEMARREADAEPIVPAIVHLRVGHYTAIVRASGGLYLLRDAILGDRWISRAALDDEGSGYVLVPATPSGSGWRDVEPHEATAVRGHCVPGLPDSDDNGPEENDGDPDDDGDGDGGDDDDSDDPDEEGDGDGDDPADGDDSDESNDDDGGGDDDTDADTCPIGMPQYSLQPLTAALRLQDVPLRYTPPSGPQVELRLLYDHRQQSQPQTFAFGNVGPAWETNWGSSYILESPGACTLFGCAGPTLSVILRGYGREGYDGSPATTQNFGTNWRTKATMVRVSRDPIRYERRLRGGGIEVYEHADGGIEGQRRVFLSQIIDSRGHSIGFTYDSQMRLVGVTDAIGQVTTLAYEHATDPLKLTKVTDPFGRIVTLTYTSAGQLASVTDVIGMTSSFVYGTDDVITSMTTPYGTTSFKRELPTDPYRFIEVTDPLGAKERLESRYSVDGMPATLPASEVPTGFTFHNDHLDHWNSFYWNKRAMALHPGDLSKAKLTHWTLAYSAGGHAKTGSIPHSIKRPLEGRVWYAYLNQHPTVPRDAGDWKKPIRVGRVLDDGTSRISQRTYNSMGRKTSWTDPLGRSRTYSYAANGIDVLEVRQTTGGISDLVKSYANYNAQHRPGVETDQAGQSTTFTYDAAGQILTTTNAKGETATYTYDADGYLETSTGSVTGAIRTYVRDDYARVRNATDADGYSVTVDFDALDRVTKLTYPDGTYEQIVYNRLDPVEFRDRLGRSTRTFYDALRRPVAVRDAAGRSTTFTWCGCGSLDRIVDASGQTITWERDLQGRVTKVVRADGTTWTTIGYENSTSRAKTETDPKGQITTIGYFADGAVASITHTNAGVPTAAVSYTYDTAYRRVATMTDGTGTTLFTYKPAGSLGAGQVASADGPLPNDTFVVDYDELGRPLSRSIGTTATTTWTYDALGRVSAESNFLGTFGMQYDGVSDRLTQVTYPSGQSTTYDYFGNTGDHRLKTIHHIKPDTTTLSKFDYTYDAVENIHTWRHQVGVSSATVDHFQYDRVDQLLAAARKTEGGAVLKRYAYTYDAAFNRVTEQIDDAVNKSVYDNLNRLTSQEPSGAIRIAGTVSEPATVSVQGRAADVAADNTFSGQAEVAAGTSVITVTARDANGNVQTNQYEVDAAGTSHLRTYDANGNLTSDGAKTFEWDATDRLIAVVEATRRSEFSYDGMRRLVRIVEKDNGNVLTARRFIWCALEICQERDDTGTTVTQNISTYGSKDNAAVSTFFVRDHLDSVTAAGDATFDYDPYGRRTRTGGTSDTEFGYNGHFIHAPTGLVMAPFRVYDPHTGRWLSEDPAGLSDGLNQYAYVSGNPVGFSDPSGLAGMSPGRKGGRKGERKKTGRPDGTDNEFKKLKPDPNNPNQVVYKDPHTGKPKTKAKPPGFDEYWEKKHPPQQKTSYCSENPGACIGATMVIIGVGAICIILAPELLPLLVLAAI